MPSGNQPPISTAAAGIPWVIVTRVAAGITGALMLHYGWEYWNFGRIYVHHEIAVMDLLVYTMAFGFFWLALVDTAKWRHLTGPLILTATILVAVIGVYVWTHSVFRTYTTDVMAFDHYAAGLILRGVDPYTVSMRSASQIFHVPLLYQTLTWDGHLVDRVSYPAGSFLMFVPFVGMGVSDLRWVVALSHVAVIVLLYFAAPPGLRPLALLPMLASPELVEFTGGGVVDFPWVLALLLTIVYQQRPPLAGLCYGAACALKQEPWFLGPFLVVYYLRERPVTTPRTRLLRLGAFALSAAALFLVVNGPFIVHNPYDWALGVLEPAFGNLIAFGEGPSTIVQLGAAISANSFTFLAAAIMILLLVSYSVYFDRLRDAVWVFPVLITWFMPRSLHNYFVFWIPPITLALMLRAQRTIGEDSDRAA